MECSIASSYNNKSKSDVTSSNKLTVKSEKSSKIAHRVNFSEKGEVKERREKFLTAKYGSHQMILIRKRLAVEMWLYEEIQKLSSGANVTREIDIDIDELMDFENDEERRHHILDLMSDVADCIPEKVTEFTNELLERMKTL